MLVVGNKGIGEGLPIVIAVGLILTTVDAGVLLQLQIGNAQELTGLVQGLPGRSRHLFQGENE